MVERPRTVKPIVTTGILENTAATAAPHTAALVSTVPATTSTTPVASPASGVFGINSGALTSALLTISASPRPSNILLNVFII